MESAQYLTSSTLSQEAGTVWPHPPSTSPISDVGCECTSKQCPEICVGSSSMLWKKKPPKPPVLFISCQSQLEKERTSLSKQQEQNNRMSQLESQRASQRLRVNTHTQTHRFRFDYMSSHFAARLFMTWYCKNVKIQFKPFSLIHRENLMFQIHSNSGIIISGYTVVSESI